jgi:DCN1-like protein 1/2
MITFEGTTLFCEELGITPDDIVVLALAYELKSPRMGEWPRKQWIDGWKSLGLVIRRHGCITAECWHGTE